MTLTRKPVIYRAPSISPESSELARHESEHPEEFVPRLLLPPPRTGLSAIQYRTAANILRIANSVGLNQPQLSYVSRLSFFLVKLMVLGRPCWPFMVNLGVSAPLLVVAALDLASASSYGATLTRYRSVEHHGLSMARPWGLRTSLVLLVLHFAVVWLAGRWEALCAAAPQENHWAHWEADTIEFSP
jgi:hypothetical protein